MSGILSAIQAAGQLFGGYGLVTLGPVQFQGMEVPDQINLGGEQQLVVHKLIGGQRVVQALGRDDADLSWSGFLEGPSAESRAIQLDRLRQSGQQLTLAFGQQSFSVVVRHFAGTYKRRNWIPYSITCVVVQDNAAASQAGSTSLLDTLNNDLNSALGFNVLSTTSSLISTAQTAVNVAGALGLKSSAWVSAVSALTTAQDAIDTERLAATGTISGVLSAASSVGNMLGVTDIASAAGELSTVTSAAGDLANTVTTSSYVGRALTNLMNASA